MTLGQKLRQARIRAGLTQRQVVGDRITRNMLSQIENDLAAPSMKTLEYLAATLGVTAGWLLADETSDEAAERLPRAKAMLREADVAGCLALLEPAAEQASDEELLLLATAAAELAQRLLAQEDFSAAQRRAEQALHWNGQSLYGQTSLALRALAVLVRCAQRSGGDAEARVADYRETYLRAPEAVEYHLLLARYQLEQEHIQAAEREIWSIAELPEQHKAEYLVLRGRIAAKKEQFENARLYLQQAEELPLLPQILLRELYRAMELCCKETEDYQGAYQYAAKQLALTETS